MGIFDNFVDNLRKGLQGDIDDLLKMDGGSGDGDKLPDKAIDLPENQGAIAQKAIIDDPFFDHVHQHFIFRNKMSRISNKTLKDTSIRDWLISAIIQGRSDTMLRFSRAQQKKFDMGFKVMKRNQTGNLSAQDKQNIANIENFIYHCGRKDKTPPGEQMLFGEFLKLTCRDALTFGHIAVEKVLTRSGGIHRFRPLPAESVYRINKKTPKDVIKKEIENARKMYDSARKYSNDPSKDQQVNEPEIDYYKYVQMSYDNRVLAAFGDQDMIWMNFNPQNFADSLGYCYSPLELAVINVTNHLNIENYNANFFTHGYAARGILHLKGTVTQAQLTAFRRQFYNTISGTQHAWRTPIIAGLDDVQWVPMSGNAREMEYLNFNNHVMRAICTQFQIDPVELGLDYLNMAGNRAVSQNQQNSEYKITYSRERGLIPILMMFEDMINTDILPLIDKKLAEEYVFKFVGYDDETPQTNAALLQAEMTIHSTMNDLLKSAGKETIEHPVCELPLNEMFWGLVEKNMTRGEIREVFFGDKDASKKRELQYLPADPAFMGWQQLLLTIDRSRKQDEMQQQQMQAEQQAQQQQDSREQEQHDLAVREAKARHAHGVVAHGQDGNQESLKDTAKAYGAASKGLSVGGKTIANPINSDEADES